ncbi:MAG: hypothetical protein H8Z69_04205 [Nanohaloarchaea archaeon]|nr:hypothetical protein [Candidatus Nanohaloarchaea archaeon]
MEILNLLLSAKLLTLAGAIVTLSIYYQRRFTTRSRIADAFLQEVGKNREGIKNLKPHLKQANITHEKQVPLPGKFDYLPDGTKLQRTVPAYWFPKYEKGDIPPSSRISTAVYNGNASEITRFRKSTTNKLIDYYYDIEFIKSLIDRLHKGEELAPAAYGVLPTKINDLTQIEDLEKLLKTEKRRFPRLQRLLRISKSRLTSKIPELHRFQPNNRINSDSENLRESHILFQKTDRF